MRHFISPNPASDSTVKAQPKRKTKLNTLSIRVILIQLEQVEYQLRNKLFLHKAQIRGLNKRKADLSVELTERILEAKYKAEIKALRAEARHGIDEALLEFLTAEGNPARKALCRAPNRGHKRTKPPSPTGKTIGAFRVVRPKGRTDKLVKERKK